MAEKVDLKDFETHKAKFNGKKKYEPNLSIPDVHLDINGIVEIMFQRGIRTDIKKISEELGYTDVAVYKLVKKAPKILAALLRFMKKNDLTFEELVKEIP